MPFQLATSERIKWTGLRPIVQPLVLAVFDAKANFALAAP
jgi:hypothetical protein